MADLIVRALLEPRRRRGGKVEEVEEWPRCEGQAVDDKRRRGGSRLLDSQRPQLHKSSGTCCLIVMEITRRGTYCPHTHAGGGRYRYRMVI